MDDDLERRFERLSDQTPQGRPDPYAVVRAGRNAKRAKVAGLAIFVLVASVTSIYGAAELLGQWARVNETDPVGHTGDGKFTPAQEGDPTYILSDFEIYYPYRAVDHIDGLDPGEQEQFCRAPSRESDCEELTDHAGFSYDWRWSGDRFPGDLDCRVQLFSESGEITGEQIFGLSGLEPESRPGSDHVVAVEVSAEPASAKAECEATRYEDGEGYRFTYQGWEPYEPPAPPGEATPPDRVRLLWEGEVLDEQADSRLCHMTVWFNSGRIVRGEFTTNGVRALDEMDTRHPASDPPTDAEITCRAIDKDRS